MLMASQKMNRCDYRMLRQKKEQQVTKEQLKKRRRNKRMTQLVFLLGMLFVFAACMGLIYFKAVISSTQISINEMSSKIRDIQQSNSRLEGQIVKAANIEQIKVKASQLGMAQPASEQVCYISLSTDEGSSLKAVSTGQ